MPPIKKKKNKFALGGTPEGAALDAAGRRGVQQQVAVVDKPQGQFVVPAREAPQLQQAQQQERQVQEQQAFKQEDVQKIQEQVVVEEEALPESIIQESDRVRLEEQQAFKDKKIKDFIKRGLTPEEAELAFQTNDVSPEFSLRQSQGDKAIGAIRQVFGDVGKSLFGISLNQFLDQASDPTELSSLTGQMSEAASLLPAIEGAVNNGAISPFRALAELNSAEKDGVVLRGDMDRLAVLRPEIVGTKEYLEMRVELDVYIADIRDARGTALERLRTTEPEFNILETQDYINQLEGKKS